MKCISVKQPFAYLLAASIKNIENRTWKLPEKYKGERVLIHASGNPDKEPYMLFDEKQATVIDNIIMDVCGSYNQLSCIIGSVRFVDCVINHPSIWAEKTELVDLTSMWNPTAYRKDIYNWVATDAVLFEKPILNVKGKLSFWDYPMSEEEYNNLIKIGL